MTGPTATERRATVLARHWPVVTLLAVMAGFGYAVRVATSGDEAVTAAAPLALAALFALLLGALVLALGLLVPRTRRPGAGCAACLTVSVALLAAAPIDFTYDDGCNDHWTTAPVVLVPAYLVLRPARARGAYGDGSTLMACFSRRDQLPPLSQ